MTRKEMDLSWEAYQKIAMQVAEAITELKAIRRTIDLSIERYKHVSEKAYFELELFSYEILKNMEAKRRKS